MISQNKDKVQFPQNESAPCLQCGKNPAGPAHNPPTIICNSSFLFQALKAANAIFSIEEIESIMDDTAEAVEKQREIDALLSGQGRFSDYFLGLICCNSSLSLWFKHIFG